MTTLAVGAAIFFGLMMWRTQFWLKAVGYGLIVGGSLGNGLDRVRLGAVVDFLDVHAYGWRWPTFNLADSFLFVGVFLIFLASRRPLPEPAR